MSEDREGHSEAGGHSGEEGGGGGMEARADTAGPADLRKWMEISLQGHGRLWESLARQGFGKARFMFHSS